MRTGFCRYCQKELYKNNDYFGYCNSICCIDFSHRHNITMKEARDLDFCREEKNDLEDIIDQLELDYEEVNLSCTGYKMALEEEKEEVCNFEDKVKELKSLDWDKIKKEREEEKSYNESVLRKVDNIKKENDNIKEANDKIKKDNLLLLEQNMDILNTIKEMRGYSERFNLMDLEIDLDYDE